MITEIQRYNSGFYLEVDPLTFNEMKNYAKNYKWIGYNPSLNNCIHYFRNVLGIVNYNALSVDVTWDFTFAATDFDRICSAVNGNSFDNYEYWLKEVVKSRK